MSQQVKLLLEYGGLILGTFCVIWVISLLVRKSLDLAIKRNSQSLNADPTNFIFVKNSISFILYAIGIVWIFHKIPYFKSLGAALFAGAGVLAAIIGFASQKAFSNIIGGLFILIFKPFRVNDIIEISNSRRGTVEEITLRHTIIRDFEFKRIVIPNSQISEETIINSSITDEKIRKHIDIGISYDSDIDLAQKIIREEVSKHPLYLSSEQDVETKLVSLSDSAVIIRAYVWTKDFSDAFDLQCDVLYQVKNRFDKEQIEIPFPYRTIVLKQNKSSDLPKSISKS